ncbi:Ankyrin repeat, PH and SEC7 domain containing protein secG [Fusarium austroafricanum]|uniref:Ankyrin repeat, PH and SEC7 domain containing protein secG n=1 Tax=Fusarium austroafricanum TaxID=2364996 RepID=A0A8H4NZI6_9HYPO|nr:Ankyrin repeat, PH and SEC7 domain containing protein secG [Fusarium austroafricanum]
MDIFRAALSELLKEPPLFLAASDDDADRFQRLLQDPQNRTNLNDMVGFDCLSTAIVQNNAQIARALVSLPLSEFDFRRHPQADLGAVPPLHHAATMSRFEIFKIMADSGNVDINGRDPHSWTPLIHASDAGCTQIVEYLLQHQVNPDGSDNKGRTPLSYAAEQGHRDVVQMLLRTNAVNPDSQDQDGNTPFYYAVRHGQGAIAKILIETGRVNREVEGKAKEDRRADQLRGPRFVIEEESI